MSSSVKVGLCLLSKLYSFSSIWRNKKDRRRSQPPLHGYLARRENKSRILHMDLAKTSPVSLPGDSALEGNIGVHHHILVVRVPHCKAMARGSPSSLTYTHPLTHPSEEGEGTAAGRETPCPSSEDSPEALLCSLDGEGKV